MMTREEFKKFAAGSYVLGKSTFDAKMLEAHVDGALLAWDMLSKKQKEMEKENETMGKGNDTVTKTGTEG